MKIWLSAALVASLVAPVLAQSAEAVHEAERMRFGFGILRPPANSDQTGPNPANFDEAKAGNLQPPPLFASPEQQTPQGWQARRAELARLIEDNWVGRIPESVSEFSIAWHKEQVSAPEGASAERWTGRIVAPDGRTGPVIDATITFPAQAEQVPALIDYTYVWPGGRMPDFGGPPPPDSVQLALDRGFAHVEYRPQALQPDAAATMEQGVIGLARWPRDRTDWGALRAWAWGASRLREELAADPRIDADRISLTGHSRFGKGVLVAAAFDPAFADAHVSSSGAGGAKLMRRDFGERWENMAGPGAFHWYTPNVMMYATEGRAVADLPVDAHHLIALRAPRPLFITSGIGEKGDAWVDPRGMWIAAMLARPAWAVFGRPVPDGGMPLPESIRQALFPLGWYQHGGGHVPWPAYEEFYRHEGRFAGD